MSVMSVMSRTRVARKRLRRASRRLCCGAARSLALLLALASLVAADRAARAQTASDPDPDDVTMSIGYPGDASILNDGCQWWVTDASTAAVVVGPFDTGSIAPGEVLEDAINLSALWDTGVTVAAHARCWRLDPDDGSRLYGPEAVPLERTFRLLPVSAPEVFP